MERDGVEAEIVYPTFGLFLFSIEDPDLQFASFQAFNDWVANYCTSSPKRLFGVAMIPTEPVERAVAEMERCARAGLKAAMISVSQGTGKGYDQPIYDRIWSASEEPPDADQPASGGKQKVLCPNRQRPGRFRARLHPRDVLGGADDLLRRVRSPSPAQSGRRWRTMPDGRR